ncbi:5988_t:CDS:1, partial [Ambispora leptoticha]
MAKTSHENSNIDDDLKKILDDERYQLSWIPYNEFENIESFGKGGFATIYKAQWKMQTINYSSTISVALKLIRDTHTRIQEFAKE